MKRFKSILVVCQDDCQPEVAIERARALALQNDAKIKLVDVIDPRETEITNIVSKVRDESEGNLSARLARNHQTRLSEYEHSLRKSGIDVKAEVLKGIVFVEIVRAVLRDGHDLVIKATDPNIQFEGRHIFSSFDMHLMRKCPCPVWILRKHFDRDDLGVLAAVDPSSSAPDREDLNRLIMELSTTVCPTEASRLHVVHTWALSGQHAQLYGQTDPASPSEVEEIRRSVEEMRQQSLQRLVSQYDVGNKCERVHLIQGPAEEIVPGFADENNIDLVVMGTVGRTDISGYLMGRTAETLLNNLRCSVLAVKPPNFKTPISLGD